MESTRDIRPAILTGKLLGAVQGARARWRLRVALRGTTIALVSTVALVVLASWAMAVFSWTPASVIGARVLVLLGAAALLGWLVVRPLLRTVSDEQVALYLEEHEPTLDAAVVSAIALGSAKEAVLGDRLVASAVRRLEGVQHGRRVEAPALRLWSAFLGASVVATVALFVAGPEALRHGAKLLFSPWTTAEAASLYAVDVHPGDTTIARGGDLAVRAESRGFRAERVELVLYRSDSAAWTRVPMRADSTGAYVAYLFGVSARTDYYVEADGVRSGSFKIDVADLPYAKRIDLEYRFPEYTGRPVEKVEDGGDIAALAGTQVLVTVTATRPTRGGRLVVDGGDTVTMMPRPDGTLAGLLRVSKPGFYRIQLEGPDGRMLPASLDYAIDVLDDRPPTVRIEKPGRDTRPTAVEEVFIEVKAEDDFGVDRLELVYQVNGGEEKVIPLHASTGRRTPEITGTRTIALDELGVQAGDAVSYHARATDNDRVKGGKRTSTDIYFLNIRPFGRDYRQQQQGGGGQGGQQGGEPPNALSQQQREIVAGTFKTERDRAETPATEFQENVATLARAQAQLRERTEGLARRLVERGVAQQDSALAKIARILPQAAEEMKKAEAALASRDPKGALGAEQRALAHLQRAEAAYRDVQVSFGGEGGGGGGGGQQQAEDLADLFELERDKLRNQYESVDRAEQQQQQSDAQVDELQERLRRLAARQQQENERLRRRLDSLGSQGASRGGGGGGSQRELAQQAEEAARQLERLAREQSQPQLGETARRLQEAADAMRRAATNGDSRALADANAALERLRDAQRRLQEERGGRAGRDASESLNEARALAEEERRVQEEMRKLAEAGRDPSNELAREQRARALSERKGAMADRVRNLRERLDRQALETRREQREAARKMQEAANAVREGKLEEKIRVSRGMLDEPDGQAARAFESQIAAGLDSLVSTLEAAQRAASAGGRESGSTSVDRARELVRGLASLDERMRQRAEQGEGRPSNEQSNRAGQPGERAQSGEQGRQGAQPGQRSEQGREGSQGQQNAQNGDAQGQEGRQGSNPQGAQGGNAQGSSQQRDASQAGGGGGPPQGVNAMPRSAQGVPGVPNGTPTGAPPAAGAGRLDANDARQFGRELRERLAEAEGLRRELREQGRDVSELDRLIAQLRTATSNETWISDPGDTRQLRAQVIDGFKAFEFSLRRELLGGDGPRLLLGRSGEAPAEYRELVEKYYKALAGGRP